MAYSGLPIIEINKLHNQKYLRHKYSASKLLCRYMIISKANVS